MSLSFNRIIRSKHSFNGSAVTQEASSIIKAGFPDAYTRVIKPIDGVVLPYYEENPPVQHYRKLRRR